MPISVKVEMVEVIRQAKAVTGSLPVAERAAALRHIDDFEEAVNRLQLLATNVSRTYGRDVLRSMGLDQVSGIGIVSLDEKPRNEFNPGTRLPPG